MSYVSFDVHRDTVVIASGKAGGREAPGGYGGIPKARMH
jgi:hypothetical protein